LNEKIDEIKSYDIALNENDDLTKEKLLAKDQLHVANNLQQKSMRFSSNNQNSITLANQKYNQALNHFLKTNDSYINLNNLNNKIDKLNSQVFNYFIKYFLDIKLRYKI
jgi:hypothetical protein